MTTPATVYLVDDNDALRTAVTFSLQLAGMRVRGFASAEEFLSECVPDYSGCLVLDVRMPCMSGIALQQELAKRHITLPVLFMTGFDDITVSVAAMKNGAVDFLEKPVSPAMLLTRVREALDQDQRAVDKRLKHETAQQRVQMLSKRERQVITLVILGNTNKEISKKLNISFRTVEKYRAIGMHKLGVTNLVELCRLDLDVRALMENYPANPAITVASEPSLSSIRRH